MPNYRYKAISFTDTAVTGVIAAADEQQALAQLRREVKVVHSISAVSGEGGVDVKELFRVGRIKDKVLAMVCSQFSIILRAGLPIVRAVELIASQTEDDNLTRILKNTAADMTGGYSMADSLERNGENRLPYTFVETVRAGEQAGTLENAFDRLHTYYDRNAKTGDKVRSALTYPAFVIVVAIAVIVIIMVVAVPMFKSVFESMSMELPWPTRALIGMSDFLAKGWMFILLAVIAIAALFVSWKSKPAGRLKWASIQLKMPVLGKLQLMRGCAQFASTLSTLLAAGLPVVTALRVTGAAMDNACLARHIVDIAPGVEEGRAIGDCMREKQVFPLVLTEMTAVGEETGSLESTLDVIGEYYDNEASLASDKALSLLEPIIIVILAVFVVFLLLSVYLPMFSMYGSI